jgi:hypothetical protein
MKQLNQRDAIHYIAIRREFKASALWGDFSKYTPQQGRLSAEEYAKLSDKFEENSFVVWSYGTPIALCTEEGNWHLVEQKFSPTTSKHQNLIRRAIADSLQGVN